MSDRMVTLGPCVVPCYPITAFSHFPKDIDMREVWRLIGATVERNASAPLWLQFCALYLEGLNHGAAASEPSR